MRVLIMSDIHANYTALEAVLKDAAGQVDEIWCLGDLVGYGPDPNAVVEEIAEKKNLTCIMGNHDIGAIGRTMLEAFNGDARRSLEYHQKVLNATNLDFLRALPQQPVVREGVTFTHGSPRDPLWEYILNQLTAQINFHHFDTQLCFVGHSHIQCMFEWNEFTERVHMRQTVPDQPIKLNSRLILNPGSVGQPRDRDPRAAYAIYDSKQNTWTPRRVEYDIASVQKAIREVKLPEKNAVRIAEGW